MKVKYWFGIAQIVAACFVAPFNPPAAGALALSGINTTAQAAGEALDNKEQWKQNLNERQRMTPNNVPPKQRNSYKVASYLRPVITVRNIRVDYFKSVA